MGARPSQNSNHTKPRSQEHSYRQSLLGIVRFIEIHACENAPVEGGIGNSFARIHLAASESRENRNQPVLAGDLSPHGVRSIRKFPGRQVALKGSVGVLSSDQLFAAGVAQW